MREIRLHGSEGGADINRSFLPLSNSERVRGPHLLFDRAYTCRESNPDPGQSRASVRLSRPSGVDGLVDNGVGVLDDAAPDGPDFREMQLEMALRKNAEVVEADPALTPMGEHARVTP